MDSFFHQMLDVLEMSSHSHLEMLLCVADVNLVRQFTGDPVNDNRHSAIISVLTLAWSSPTSAVAVPHFKIQVLYTFG